MFSAGNVVPSPTPSKIRRTISQGAPPDNVYDLFTCQVISYDYASPHFIVIGVISVKIAVDKIPKLSVYFPPYLADSTPPGT